MEAPAVVLKTGWNNVVVDLNGQWLPPQGRAELSGLEWSLSAKDRHAKDYLVFDNLRAIGRNPDGTATTRSLEDFERPLLWRTFDETVRAEIVSTNRTDQTSGLLLHFDFAKCGRPVVFARLNPRWDLNKIDSLLLEIHTESSLPQDLAIAMAFRKNDVEYKTMPTPLSSDRQPIKFALNEQWLPSNIKTGVDQIEFTLTSTNVAGTAEIVFHRLSAANGS
jgi:hypothetical protein